MKTKNRKTSRAQKSMTNPYGAKVPLKRALVIDDEPIINRLNEKILRFLHIETECRNGLDGLKENQINKLKTYDILIIDLNLIKNTEGRIFGLLKQLKDQIPVLITSGYLKETAKEYLDQYDHIEYIQKPYTIDDFLHKVKNLLEA